MKIQSTDSSLKEGEESEYNKNLNRVSMREIIPTNKLLITYPNNKG